MFYGRSHFFIAVLVLSPSPSSDGTGSCQLTILKLHPEICQIRLDFEQFAIAGNKPQLEMALGRVRERNIAI
jgi:hypothetical protein